MPFRLDPHLDRLDLHRAHFILAYSRYPEEYDDRKLVAKSFIMRLIYGIVLRPTNCHKTLILQGT